MEKLLNDVAAFHVATDTPVHAAIFLDPARVALRRNLLAEEGSETDIALANYDVVEIADGLVDLIYVAVGTALELGIPLEKVWDEVHRSNMAKVDPATGEVRKREDGKVLKPEGWTPPNVRGVLFGG